jgi:hypothetical protein
MRPGRPTKADAGALYGFAHQFYWELKSVTEGLFRVYHNKALDQRLRDEAEAAQLSEEQLADADETVLRQIKSGALAENKREQRLHEVKEELLFGIKFRKLSEAAQRSRQTIPVPGEPDVIEQLLSATTPQRVVEICNDAFSIRRDEVEPGVVREVQVPNWPISSESILPRYLSQYAAEFIAAKNDPRFPRAHRPTNRLKQLWFVSRALAGSVHGIRTRTAINLVGSLRPDQMFHRSRNGKSVRRTRKAENLKRGH